MKHKTSRSGHGLDCPMLVAALLAGQKTETLLAKLHQTGSPLLGEGPICLQTEGQLFLTFSRSYAAHFCLKQCQSSVLQAKTRGTSSLRPQPVLYVHASNLHSMKCCSNWHTQRPSTKAKCSSWSGCSASSACTLAGNTSPDSVILCSKSKWACEQELNIQPGRFT